MHVSEDNENIISEFSNQLNCTYDWFNKKFLKIVTDSFTEFWGRPVSAKLVCVSENTNILSTNEEFFVTKIRLNKELSVFLRLSKQLVKSVLENILGPNGKTFNIEKISELEAKILTSFDDFLYKNFSYLIKSTDKLPQKNNNYNECNLTFFLKDGTNTLGKIIIKIPVVAINPEKVTPGLETFSINNFLRTTGEVNLKVGKTKIRLNDLKNLEKDDIVLLEESNSSSMILTYRDYSQEIRVSPNPRIMIDGNSFDENGGSLKGDNNMSNNLYNMWDTIQVEIGAEFEKTKLSLGELKQISEGLVVDIGSVYENKIDLKVEDKIVASGELVIINDRYGVKINEIFTEEKEQVSDNAEQFVNTDEFEQEEYTNEEQEKDEALNQNSDEEYKEEDFDYSDFDVDEEDI